MDNDSHFIKKCKTFFFPLLIALLLCNPIVTAKSSTDESSTAIADRLALWIKTVPDAFPGIRIDSTACAISLTNKQAEKDLHPLIVQTADRYQVDPTLVKAIIMTESRYNPLAQSKAGAMGLMQIMPATAKNLGVENGFDPEENVDAGVRYFKNLLQTFDGDVSLALAAYNAGIKNVLDYRGIPPFKETQDYIRKVFQYRRHYMG